MNLPHHWTYHLGKTALLAAALTAFATIGAPPSRADHNVDCQKRISKADHKLHEAIEHHGYKSSEAQHARHELSEAREHCFTTYHEWWDDDSQSWHTDRDWKDEDHEHYHEKDHDRNHDEHP